MKKSYKFKIFKLSKNLKKNELSQLIIKSVFSDLRFSNNIRFFFIRFLFDNFLTKINFFCIKTNQIRGLSHFFNIFRMNFRDNALFARYSGLKKKSW